jgi:hypothetical protein
MPPADQLPDRIAADYLRLLDQQAIQDGAHGRDEREVERVVMLAVRRADVTDLNDTARQRLLADGRLRGSAPRRRRAGVCTVAPWALWQVMA